MERNKKEGKGRGKYLPLVRMMTGNMMETTPALVVSSSEYREKGARELPSALQRERSSLLCRGISMRSGGARELPSAMKTGRSPCF